MTLAGSLDSDLELWGKVRKNNNSLPFVKTEQVYKMTTIFDQNDPERTKLSFEQKKLSFWKFESEVVNIILSFFILNFSYKDVQFLYVLVILQELTLISYPFLISGQHLLSAKGQFPLTALKKMDQTHKLSEFVMAQMKCLRCAHSIFCGLTHHRRHPELK